MQFRAYIESEQKGVAVKFPDIPELEVIAPTRGDAIRKAEDELNQHLESLLAERRVPERPKERRESVTSPSVLIPVRHELDISLQLIWARREQGLSLSEVGNRMGVSRQRIARLESGSRNWTVETLRRLSDALGVDFRVVMERREQ
jgi:ribosome-binding protein aMBF1 (putative translation factor)